MNDLCSAESSDDFSGNTPYARPNAVRTRRACRRSKQIDRGRVLALDQPDLQVPHEPRRRHPEIVAYHHDRLDVLAVALPKRGDQLRVLPRLRRAKSHCSNWSRTSKHFLSGPDHPPAPQRREYINERPLVRQVGANLSQTLLQPRLGLLRCRLDVNRQYVLAQSRGNKPALTIDDLPQPEGP